MPLISSEEHELLDGPIPLSTSKKYYPPQESIRRMCMIGSWSVRNESTIKMTWWINILNDCFDRLRKENAQ